MLVNAPSLSKPSQVVPAIEMPCTRWPARWRSSISPGKNPIDTRQRGHRLELGNQGFHPLPEISARHHRFDVDGQQQMAATTLAIWLEGPAMFEPN